MINRNTRDLLKGFEMGLVSEKEIRELEKVAIEDEEYEVAISIRDVLDIINAKKLKKQ